MSTPSFFDGIVVGDDTGKGLPEAQIKYREPLHVKDNESIESISAGTNAELLSKEYVNKSLESIFEYPLIFCNISAGDNLERVDEYYKFIYSTTASQAEFKDIIKNTHFFDKSNVYDDNASLRLLSTSLLYTHKMYNQFTKYKPGVYRILKQVIVNSKSTSIDANCTTAYAVLENLFMLGYYLNREIFRTKAIIARSQKGSFNSYIESLEVVAKKIGINLLAKRLSALETKDLIAAFAKISSFNNWKSNVPSMEKTARYQIKSAYLQDLMIVYDGNKKEYITQTSDKNNEIRSWCWYSLCGEIFKGSYRKAKGKIKKTCGTIKIKDYVKRGTSKLSSIINYILDYFINTDNIINCLDNITREIFDITGVYSVPFPESLSEQVYELETLANNLKREGIKTTSEQGLRIIAINNSFVAPSLATYHGEDEFNDIHFIAFTFLDQLFRNHMDVICSIYELYLKRGIATNQGIARKDILNAIHSTYRQYARNKQQQIKKQANNMQFWKRINSNGKKRPKKQQGQPRGHSQEHSRKQPHGGFQIMIGGENIDDSSLMNLFKDHIFEPSEEGINKFCNAIDDFRNPDTWLDDFSKEFNESFRDTLIKYINGKYIDDYIACAAKFITKRNEEFSKIIDDIIGEKKKNDKFKKVRRFGYIYERYKKYAEAVESVGDMYRYMYKIIPLLSNTTTENDDNIEIYKAPARYLQLFTKLPVSFRLIAISKEDVYKFIMIIFGKLILQSRYAECDQLIKEFGIKIDIKNLYENDKNNDMKQTLNSIYNEIYKICSPENKRLDSDVYSISDDSYKLIEERINIDDSLIYKVDDKYVYKQKIEGTEKIEIVPIISNPIQKNLNEIIEKIDQESIDLISSVNRTIGLLYIGEESEDEKPSEPKKHSESSESSESEYEEDVEVPEEVVVEEVADTQNQEDTDNNLRKDIDNLLDRFAANDNYMVTDDDINTFLKAINTIDYLNAVIAGQEIKFNANIITDEKSSLKAFISATYIHNYKEYCEQFYKICFDSFTKIIEKIKNITDGNEKRFKIMKFMEICSKYRVYKNFIELVGDMYNCMADVVKYAYNTITSLNTHDIKYNSICDYLQRVSHGKDKAPVSFKEIIIKATEVYKIIMFVIGKVLINDNNIKKCEHIIKTLFNVDVDIKDNEEKRTTLNNIYNAIYKKCSAPNSQDNVQDNTQGNVQDNAQANVQDNAQYILSDNFYNLLGQILVSIKQNRTSTWQSVTQAVPGVNNSDNNHKFTEEFKTKVKEDLNKEFVKELDEKIDKRFYRPIYSFYVPNRSDDDDNGVPNDNPNDNPKEPTKTKPVKPVPDDIDYGLDGCYSIIDMCYELYEYTFMFDSLFAIANVYLLSPFSIIGMASQSKLSIRWRCAKIYRYYTVGNNKAITYLNNMYKSNILKLPWTCFPLYVSDTNKLESLSVRTSTGNIPIETIHKYALGTMSVTRYLFEDVKSMFMPKNKYKMINFTKPISFSDFRFCKYGYVIPLSTGKENPITIAFICYHYYMDKYSEMYILSDSDSSMLMTNDNVGIVPKAKPQTYSVNAMVNGNLIMHMKYLNIPHNPVLTKCGRDPRRNLNE